MTKTDRALKATQTIEALGGLQKPRWGATRVVTASDALVVLGLIKRLKLDVPNDLADTLSSTALMRERAQTLKAAPATFTADDFAADDYEARFAAAVAGQLCAIAKTDELIARAVAPAIEQAVGAARRSSEALIGQLNRAYPTNPTSEIREAHTILLNWQGSLSRQIDAYAEWCLLFAWPQEAWNTLASRTRLPGHPAPQGVTDFDHAIACGATPYLALSLRDAEARAAHHTEAFKDWRDAEAVARTQAYVQQESDRQIAEVRRSHEHHRADALAYIRAADKVLTT